MPFPLGVLVFVYRVTDIVTQRHPARLALALLIVVVVLEWEIIGINRDRGYNNVTGIP